MNSLLKQCFFNQYINNLLINLICKCCCFVNNEM